MNSSGMISPVRAFPSYQGVFGSLGQRKGKLTVEFASVEDLNRIVGLLGVEPRS